MRRLSAYLLTFFTLAGMVATCGHFQPAARPLYPGPALPAAEVARLSGPIAKVDGVDVAGQGGVFALLPGCHVVELQQRIGEGGVSGAWSTELRHATYAFRMRAGASYEIDVHLQAGNNSVGNGTVGRVQVEAVERAPDGKVAATILPARKPADIEACQRWEEETGASRSPDGAARDADAGGAAAGG